VSALEMMFPLCSRKLEIAASFADKPDAVTPET
jgi:hypothetical protein